MQVTYGSEGQGRSHDFSGHPTLAADILCNSAIFSNMQRLIYRKNWRLSFLLE
jgi:hypothetical protein